MLCLPKRMPGSPSGSEEDEASGNDAVLKSNKSENVEEPSLVGNFLLAFVSQ